ncbi:MAG: S8 family serine peptidase [Cyclobacteriaceae bacterium]|nr:S8 family serine peptidase [Cyclobacteriaceae bacterium]MCH8516395.1 S8 family serine peptidase [Cyclobacteriaceae bacterium]
MKIRRLFLLFTFLLSGVHSSQAQWWIFFKDKCDPLISTDYVSADTRANRVLLQIPVFQHSDIPICKVYLNQVESEGATVVAMSKWLNAALLNELPSHWTEDLPDFIDRLEYHPPKEIIVARAFNTDFFAWDESSRKLSSTLQQIEGQALLDAGLSGKGVRVALLDAGYNGLLQSAVLQHLLDSNRIHWVKDFVKGEDADSMFKRKIKGDTHGRDVLKMVGGFNNSRNLLIGLAWEADYYLFRTEDEDSEYRGEEVNWMNAIEIADSMGIRLVNTSLGYGSGFDDPLENYLPEQMDGNTALISQVARQAIREKGMIIVSSAGNEGNDPWKIISAPADVKEVISVGANTLRTQLRLPYSSIGSDGMDFVKPDVSCFASSGTSFSAPVITGLVACMLEKDARLNAQKVQQLLHQSASFYPAPNNHVGYGTPSAEKVLQLMDGLSVATDWQVEDFKDLDYNDLQQMDISQYDWVWVAWKTDHVVLNEFLYHQADSFPTMIDLPKDFNRLTIFTDKLRKEFIIDGQ